MTRDGTTPASGGSSTTFFDGVANSYSVVCYGTSGVSGTTAYPASVTLNSGTLPPAPSSPPPPRAVPPAPRARRDRRRREVPTHLRDHRHAHRGAEREYSVTFTVNPGTDGGTAVTSGTLTISVSSQVTACSAPAAAGSCDDVHERHRRELHGDLLQPGLRDCGRQGTTRPRSPSPRAPCPPTRRRPPRSRAARRAPRPRADRRSPRSTSWSAPSPRRPRAPTTGPTR